MTKLCLWRIINMGNPYDYKFVEKAKCYIISKELFKLNINEHVYEAAEGDS